MDINEFKSILSAFADEASDVDIRGGKVVAQIREDLIDAAVSYSEDEHRHLLITENGERSSARTWLMTRVARLPQLADRIISTTSVSTEVAAKSPFVVPTGKMSDDLGAAGPEDDRPVPDAVQAMLEKCTSAVPGTTSILYLTSDAGEGKTTIIGRAARIQAQLFKERKAGCLLVPIPLSGRAFLTFDDAVIAALVNKLRFNYLYFDAFVALVRMGVLVPAFDGYEEMLVEGSKGEAVSALGNLIQSLDSSGSVVIAARKAFFEYLSFKTQARLLDAIGGRAASFSKLELCRWTKDQFCNYGTLRKVQYPEEVFNIVAGRLGEDHPLLTRAVLVRRLFDVMDTKPNAADLTTLLGNNPQDYFYTFVDAIIKREADDKWLARVTGDVSEPLLTVAEHHDLLSTIAQEMWESSVTSLRFDVLDAVVDLFCDGLKKNPTAARQIRERSKQHSLLVVDSVRKHAVSFDHEDFLAFYLGESLGRILGRVSKTELQTFLSINVVPVATVEQAVQHLIRKGQSVIPILDAITAINSSENGFTFCKENCGALAIRLAECRTDQDGRVSLVNMIFSAAALSSRRLRKVEFDSCHFSPTTISNSVFEDVIFRSCEFDRLEATSPHSLRGCLFSDCRIDSILAEEDGDLEFDPARIEATLLQLEAGVGPQELLLTAAVPESDDRLRVFERFLRVFLRNTHVDEHVVRVRMGKNLSPLFFDQVLPVLLNAGILEEVPWRGRGVQRRWKLAESLFEIHEALQRSSVNFESFIAEVLRNK